MPRLVAVAGLAGLALAACSSTTVIDANKAEAEIETVLDDAGVSAATVTCPTDIEAAEGESFDCEVTTTDDVTFAMVVTMADDEGRVDIASSPDVVLMTSQVMQLAADEVAAQAGEDVELLCPSAAPLDEGTGFVACTAEGASGAGSVTLGFEAGQLVSATID
nr:DUF4333 domain-containing protein [Rhabdothermincola salaria]